MLALLGVAFVIGALAILVVEAAGVFLVIRHIKRRVAQQEEEQRKGVEANPGSSPVHHDPSFSNKQGLVWILESENMRKNCHTDNLLRGQKRKKEILEILPVQKHAIVKDNLLFVSESDGSRTEVKLTGCTVAAVSATNLSSRKWLGGCRGNESNYRFCFSINCCGRRKNGERGRGNGQMKD